MTWQQDVDEKGKFFLERVLQERASIWHEVGCPSGVALLVSSDLLSLSLFPSQSLSFFLLPPSLYLEIRHLICCAFVVLIDAASREAGGRTRTQA